MKQETSLAENWAAWGIPSKRESPGNLLLEASPFPPGAIALQGKIGYRIRIGDYRILYEVNEPSKIITITAIGHRREVYRGLC